MITVDSETGRVNIEGFFPELIIELQIVIDRLALQVKESVPEEAVPELKNYILEACAFALCEEEEQAEFLDQRIEEALKKWKEE